MGRIWPVISPIEAGWSSNGSWRLVLSAKNLGQRAACRAMKAARRLVEAVSTTEANAMSETEIARTRLTEVEARIAAAAAAAKRDASSVHLIAVSKTFEAPAILPTLEAGHRRFGENRVQEAKGKWPALRQQYPGYRAAPDRPAAIQQGARGRGAVRCHPFHRPAQDRQGRGRRDGAARQAAGTCSFRSIPARRRRRPACCRRSTAQFVAYCRDELKLAIAGLMCIPPQDEEAGVHFAFLSTARGRSGLDRAQHGHERGLRDGDCLRRHARARGQCHFRASRLGARFT